MCVVRIYVNNRCGTKHVYERVHYIIYMCVWSYVYKNTRANQHQPRKSTIQKYRSFIFGLTDLCINLNVARSDLPQILLCLPNACNVLNSFAKAQTNSKQQQQQKVKTRKKRRMNEWTNGFANNEIQTRRV